MKSCDIEGSVLVKLFDDNESIEKISDYAIEQDFSMELDFSNKYFTQF